MLFSIGTGLEHVGVVWPDLACWRAGLQAPGSSWLRLDRYNAELQAPNVVFLCKNENDEGSVWVSSVATSMPKLDSF